MIASLADRLLDAAVVPGYTSLGYRLRGLSWGSAVAGDLAGTDVLVTGASSGLGEAACEGLARAGARVHMLVRDPQRGDAARARVAAAVGSTERLELERCDLADLEAVREFTRDFGARVPSLAVLVNNAGVLTQERERSPDGHELTFATNVLGPFALTAGLLESLRGSGRGRVINVTSGGMFTSRLDAGDLQLERREFSGSSFYAHSKRAEMALTVEWAERLRVDEVVVHAMHPGWADTPGLAESLPRFRRVMRPFLRDARAGADTIVWVATAPEPGRCSGKLWHDRRPRAVHRVPFTRESPADRGRLWNECARLAGVDLARLPLAGTPA